MQLVDRRTYRAKKPAHAQGFVNDRTIVRLNTVEKTVTYNGPEVERGTLPAIPMKEFLKWASHDVTMQLPGGCYQEWLEYLAIRKSEKRLGVG